MKIKVLISRSCLKLVEQTAATFNAHHQVKLRAEILLEAKITLALNSIINEIVSCNFLLMYT